MNKPTSPITGEGAVTLLYNIDTRKLVSDYASLLGINIEKYLKGLDAISLYKCDATGYRFYYPFDICGDGEFYAQLEAFDWYYLDSKWEHDQALRSIKAGDRVLEIGAASGRFLQRAMEIDNVNCVGLELNQSAAAKAKDRGINVIVESAEDHAVDHPDSYDVLCLFQVLEHIPDPASLLDSAMKMLRRGGRLIVAVPDNSARARTSIFVTEDSILNMPPHHLGLWDSVSLAALSRIYPVSLEFLVVEPAEADYQKNSYRELIKKNMKKKYGPLGFAYYLAIRRILISTIDQLAGYLPAHSILASYVKQD